MNDSLRSLLPWLGCALLVFTIIGFVFVGGSGGDAAQTRASDLAERDGGPPSGVRRARADSVATRGPSVSIVADALSVTDAVLHGGMWFLLDGNERRIHRLDVRTGTVDLSFGGSGGGPGEFRSAPLAITVHEGSIAVADVHGWSFFKPGGELVSRRSISRSGPMCTPMNGTGAVSSPAGLLMVEQCIDPTTRAFETKVVLDDGTPVVHSMKQGDLAVDLEAVIVLAAHPDGFLFGNAVDDCIALHKFDGGVIRTVCHDWMWRIPAPDWLVDSVAAYNRQGALGAVMRIGHLPRFSRVFVVDGGLLAYARPVQAGLGSWTLRLVVPDEERGERALPIATAPALFASGSSVLAAWPELGGVRVAVYSLDHVGVQEGGYARR